MGRSTGSTSSKPRRTAFPKAEVTRPILPCAGCWRATNGDLNLNVLKNIVRTGWVSSVNVEERTARVIFEDKGETIVSGELKVLKNPPWIPEYYAPYRTEYEAGGSGYPQFESHKHDLIVKPWLPQKGEFVLCLYIPRDDGDGFVIGGDLNEWRLSEAGGTLPFPFRGRRSKPLTG